MENDCIADLSVFYKLVTVFDRLKMDGYELGRSKVFLKYYHIEYLTKTYEYYLERVIRVQSAVRQWIGRKKLKRQKWIMARRLDHGTVLRCQFPNLKN